MKRQLEASGQPARVLPYQFHYTEESEKQIFRDYEP
jgi:hypothetical protein